MPISWSVIEETFTNGQLLSGCYRGYLISCEEIGNPSFLLQTFYECHKYLADVFFKANSFSICLLPIVYYHFKHVRVFLYHRNVS